MRLDINKISLGSACNVLNDARTYIHITKDIPMKIFSCFVLAGICAVSSIATMVGIKIGKIKQ